MPKLLDFIWSKVLYLFTKEIWDGFHLALHFPFCALLWLQ